MKENKIDQVLDEVKDSLYMKKLFLTIVSCIIGFIALLIGILIGNVIEIGDKDVWGVLFGITATTIAFFKLVIKKE